MNRTSLASIAFCLSLTQARFIEYTAVLLAKLSCEIDHFSITICVRVHTSLEHHRSQFRKYLFDWLLRAQSDYQRVKKSRNVSEFPRLVGGCLLVMFCMLCLVEVECCVLEIHLRRDRMQCLVGKHGREECLPSWLRPFFRMLPFLRVPATATAIRMYEVDFHTTKVCSQDHDEDFLWHFHQAGASCHDEKSS